MCWLKDQQLHRLQGNPDSEEPPRKPCDGAGRQHHSPTIGDHTLPSPLKLGFKYLNLWVVSPLVSFVFSQNSPSEVVPPPHSISAGMNAVIHRAVWKMSAVWAAASPSSRRSWAFTAELLAVGQSQNV